MTDYLSQGWTDSDLEPVRSLDDLELYFHRAAKPREQWRIGTEYEHLAVEATTGRAAPFSGERGVEAVLRAMADRFDWEPREEGGRIVGLRRGSKMITLEPGGQIELAGEPLETLHGAHQELTEFLNQIGSVGRASGLTLVGLGVQPRSRVDEIEQVPKQRYGIMAPYMSSVGSMGIRMMRQTASVQTNIDYLDEHDAMAKMQVATGLAPLLTALFANSPIADGQPTGYMSFRGHIWTETDPARCGLLPFIWRGRASFADYVQYALDVPMYFIIRDGHYVDLTGTTFRRFLAEGHASHRAVLRDWRLHLTTLFPEVRLKGYIEVRSADGQRPEMMLAFPALVKGVLYEADCQEAAWDLVKRWSWDDLLEAYHGGHRRALAHRVRRIRLADLAQELFEIARTGLARQACTNARREDETIYLERLEDYVGRGKSPAEVQIERWEGEWHRDLDRLIALASYAGEPAGRPAPWPG